MDTEQLAHTNQLGNPVQEFKQQGSVMGILVGLFFLGIGLFFLLAGKKQIVTIGVALFFGGLGVWLVYMAIVDRNNRQLLYEHGLIDLHRGKAQVLRYDRMTAVWQRVTRHYRNGFHTGTTYYYRIKTDDAEAISSYQVVGERVQDEVTRRLMPQVAQTYNSGGDVAFGPLTLNKQGLTSKKGTLLWEEIKGVEVRRGYIFIQKKDGGWFNWTNTSVETIPNLFIFLSLIDQICGIAKS